MSPNRPRKEVRYDLLSGVADGGDGVVEVEMEIGWREWRRRGVGGEGREAREHKRPLEYPSHVKKSSGESYTSPEV